MLDDSVFEQASAAVERIYEDAAVIAFGVAGSFHGSHAARPWPAWFCETIERLPTLPTGDFEPVWREALTPSWFGVLANRAAAANKGGTEDAAKLDSHIAQFSLFSAGFRRAGAKLPPAPSSVVFDRDVLVPGTEIGLSEGRPIGIYGDLGEHDVFDYDVAVWKHARLRLAPEALDLPWEPFEPVANAKTYADGKGLEAQELVVEMLKTMERYQPEIFERFSADIGVIGLLDSASADVFNASNSSYFGGFIVAAIDNPYELAAYALHEHAHNLLFAIETVEPTLEGEQGEYEGPTIYSPWREDRRPLRGLFHAVFVHLPVCAFWLSVSRRPDTDEIGRYANDQLIRFLIQIDIGMDILERQAQLTPSGEEIMVAVKAEVIRLRAAALDLGGFPDNPSLVCRPGGIQHEMRGGQRISLRDSLIWHAERAAAPKSVFSALDQWPNRAAHA